MDIKDIISKKIAGAELNAAEIGFFVDGVTDNSLPDYQVAALLAAVCCRGMTDEEAYLLTRFMKESGDIIDASFAGGVVADKHSTGGVSDTVTLVLVPVLAELGLKMLKMSGRGLGHTGGTIDKLESISGFRTELSAGEIERCVRECNAVICAQTADLAPADKRLYALRDVTATVESIPLIASSVMSKKLASGGGVILLDVKYGSGAFMKTAAEAEKLARLMVSIGKRDGKICAAAVTSMQQPLTGNVGCNREVRGAVEVLKGARNDLYLLAVELCARLLVMAGKAANQNDGRKIAEETLAGGAALRRFARIIECQGGDPAVLNNPEKYLPDAGFSFDVTAERGGYVSAVDAESVGRAAMLLGGGRQKKDDVIDHGAGLYYRLRIGGRVEKGESVATLYSSDKGKFAAAAELIRGSYSLSDSKPKEEKLIYSFID